MISHRYGEYDDPIQAIVIYVVEAWLKGHDFHTREYNHRSSSWTSICGDCLWSWLGMDVNKLLGKDRREFDQFKNIFGSSGDCWQKTGINGTFDLVEARLLMNAAHKARPDCEFRIVKYIVVQDIVDRVGEDPVVKEFLYKEQS